MFFSYIFHFLIERFGIARITRIGFGLLFLILVQYALFIQGFLHLSTIPHG